MDSNPVEGMGLLMLGWGSPGEAAAPLGNLGLSEAKGGGGNAKERGGGG